MSGASKYWTLLFTNNYVVSMHMHIIGASNLVEQEILRYNGWKNVGRKSIFNENYTLAF